LLDGVRDQLADSTMVSRALTGLTGRPVTDSMIRGYAHRGRITRYPPHPFDPANKPRYRMGEVIDLLGSLATSKSRTLSSA
jgi:hypothetical protein